MSGTCSVPDVTGFRVSSDERKGWDMRILVVEDDRKVASFIQTGLGQEGYAVDVLHDGTDAGDQARTIDYDAVVLDLADDLRRMGGRDELTAREGC